VSPRGSLIRNENCIATAANHFDNVSKLSAIIGMGNKFLQPEQQHQRVLLTNPQLRRRRNVTDVAFFHQLVNIKLMLVLVTQAIEQRTRLRHRSHTT
jgi:hypothetical protein